MKKLIVMFFIAVVMNALYFSTDSGFVLSIIPQHEEGFFVEFSAIGFSLGTMEISTQPLLDILGLFNIRYRNYRNYFSQTSVLCIETYFFDPMFVSKAYAGQPYEPENQNYLVFNKSYIHSNFVVQPLIIKAHTEFLTILVGNYNFSQHVGSTISRGFASSGILLGRNIELFVTIEAGLALYVWTSEHIEQNVWKELVDLIREKTFYSSFRGGLTWYYDNYSGLEIGYRTLIYGIDSPLRFIQGYNLTDYIYNIVNFFRTISNEQIIDIPFITTDYYLSFSTKF